MTTDWSDLAEAIEAHARAYMDMLAARAENRENSRKVKKAEAAWEEAHQRRAEAAAAHWVEEDGMRGEFRSIGATIQRYYAETQEKGKKVKR